MAQGSHDAAHSAVGYQHQTWWALVELLRSGPERPDSSLTLEMYDDIAWDASGTPTELLQIKHHQGNTRRLTDRAMDVWKTIQVWMDHSSPTDISGPSLVLVTTQTAAPGSAMALLRADDRNEASALAILESVAAEEGADDTRKTRQQFLALEASARRTFVHRMRVADGSPHAEDVHAAARTALQWTLPPGHEELFMAMVWKWWDGQALALLQGRLASLDVGSAQAAIAEIRDQFTSENLPTLVHLADVDEAEISEQHRTRPFVQQMEWVAYPPRNLQKAIVDYYRAYAQAVQWVDEDLIGIAELERFEAELVDEWEREFEWMTEGLDEGADEKAKQAAGRSLLRTLLGQTGITVRSRYNDPFFARGHRHALADSGRVGWHADFEDRINQLLHVHA
ncbi:ABC-three component system protein [Streptomyces sp. HPF1205]|uniref:ABC-three component system protein n=1 Tax=Streptomyces sp. HPF1205 TaxID=2873262 RepID=UPI001CEC2BCB|nr:ABC-three component system protein [Streptomyces sp. HPF1205]